jgi:hypothetical protein
MKKQIDLSELDYTIDIVYFAGTQFDRDTEPGVIAYQLDHILTEFAWGESDPTEDDYRKFAVAIGHFRKAVEAGAAIKDCAKFSDLCKNRMFDKTYWGQFELTYRNMFEVRKLAENRDNFANNFDLAKRANVTKAPNGTAFDHLEAYVCDIGSVHVIVSPYSDEDLSKYFFIKIGKMYSYNANTWYRAFINMREYNKFCDDLKE